jgi:hypothetical protein
MVDYYKIVQRFVAELNPDTEATRQALYERARAALAKQLVRKDPPAPGDSIRAEFAALEGAIKKIEDEARNGRHEIKGKKKPVTVDSKRVSPTRSTVFHSIASALLLVAGFAYFVLWMRFSVSSSIATALVLLLVFALPAAFVFVFAIYPILYPLLWLLRWINKKSLQRLVGGETAANAAGATVLSAALCTIGAFEAPGLFSWWAAGCCWMGCVFLLTLDPGIVVTLRAWLSSLPRRKAAPAEGVKTPGNEGISPLGIDQEAQGASTQKGELKNVA